MKRIKRLLRNIFKDKTWFIKLTCKSVDFKAVKNKKISFTKGAISFEYKKNISNRNIKSVAIFSCFSKSCSISKSLIYYLRELNKIVDSIVVIFDNPILPSEIGKFNEIKGIIYICCKRHRKYDFGSYQRGIEFLYSVDILNKIDYLFLCNDSCYGPIYNISSIVKEMNARNNDFWGMIENTDFCNHVQSWFLCLKKQVLINKKVLLFFKKIRKQKFVWDVILKYEIGFTNFLVQSGYKYDTFIPKNTSPVDLKILNKSLLNNLMIYPIELIDAFSFPFIKKKCFSEYIKFNDETEQIIVFLKKKNIKLYEIVLNELRLK